MKRIILHIDMDAFYASVEQLDNPSLKGKPVIVGGSSNRGVVSASNYEARKFGVHSAMPIFQAKKRCPHGIFLPVRMARYKAVSQKIMEILEEFTPLIEQVSIDEAYMDISGTEKLFGSPKEIGVRIKNKIREGTSLTCSIGIAPSKFLAKIASELEKPDGLKVISPDDVTGFIEKLPIQKVPGVGEKTVKVLHGLGIFKLGDLGRTPEEYLQKKTGKFGQRLLELSRGIDESEVVPYNEPKSISSEDTLSSDTDDRNLLKKRLMIQSENVGKRLRARRVKASTVILKLKRANFKTITRSITLSKETSSSNLIYEQGIRLLEEVDVSKKVRLIGIGVSHLVREDRRPVQLNLFEKSIRDEMSWERVEKVIDRIHEKFGRESIKRGGYQKDP
ncbi:MAG: DNA polymerase IV [Pseudomonadota bacterium]